MDRIPPVRRSNVPTADAATTASIEQRVAIGFTGKRVCARTGDSFTYPCSRPRR